MSGHWVPVGALVVHSGHVSHTHALGSRGRRAFLNRCQMHAKMTQRQTAKDYKRFLFLFDTPARDKSLMVRGSRGAGGPRGRWCRRQSAAAAALITPRCNLTGRGNTEGKVLRLTGRWNRLDGVGLAGVSTRVPWSQHPHNPHTASLHHCTTADFVLHSIRRESTSIHSSCASFSP